MLERLHGLRSPFQPNSSRETGSFLSPLSYLYRNQGQCGLKSLTVLGIYRYCLLFLRQTMGDIFIKEKTLFLFYFILFLIFCVCVFCVYAWVFRIC